MAVKIKVPELGSGVEECSILTWFKKEGDQVFKEDALCEIEVEKAVIEVVSSDEGILRKIFCAEGDMIPADTLIAVIAGPDEDISSIQ